MDDKTFSERMDLICEGSWWKRIDDDAIGTILEIRDDNSNNLIVRWTHPSFEGSRAGEYDRYEFVRKWVPLPSHPDDVPVKVDSIWKSNKTGDIVKVLIAPTGSDLSVHYINLNDITGHHGMSHMDRAAFITEHTFLRDNDNGALYRQNKNVNMYFKVIETTEKACMGAWMRFVKYRSIAGDTVKEDGCFIVTFHSHCHLLSLDPEKEYTVPIDSVRTIKVEENEMTKIPCGSLWVDVETGKETVKVSFIASKNGEVFVHYVNIATGIERAEKLEEFVTMYEHLKDNDLSAIYERRNNPLEWVQIVVCNPNSTCTSYHHYGGEFNGRDDENDITNFHKQYKLITFYPSDADIERMNINALKSSKYHKIAKELRDLAKERDITIGSIWKEVKGESKMEDNRTYLKTDKNKLEDFGTGAKREDKTGKGRYDLIPGDVMSEFEDFVWEAYFKNGTTTCSPTDVSKSAYFDDWTNVELYYDFMFNVVSLFFVPSIDREECEDDNGEISYEITWDGFRAGLYEMRKQLALHYEAGAVVHGVDNWKKGLPIYGSERGGCFLDSMRRHTDQALQGKDDEPHAVAALWNAFGAVWTLKHRPNSAMYQNASAVKAEEASTVNDIMESLITSWNPNRSEDK